MSSQAYHVVERLYNRLLRPYLPRRLAYFGGYVVRFPKLFDQMDVKEEMQTAEREAHDNHTRRGDTVVVVGVGAGVSTIAAAEAVGEEGHVIGYEASNELASAQRESMRLNGVEDRVEIIGKPVSDITLNTWGSDISEESVPPADLPGADVLELDCEGAELEILRGLEQRPRVLSIEVHPQLGIQTGEVTDWLTENGYVIVTVEDDGSDETASWVVATRAE